MNERGEWTHPVDGLGGTIPPELGNSTSLRFVGLHQNRIQGSIPKELGRMTKLTSLDLAVNRLTGSIPPELGNITVRRHPRDDTTRIRHSLHGRRRAVSNGSNGLTGERLFAWTRRQPQICVTSRCFVFFNRFNRVLMISL